MDGMKGLGRTIATFLASNARIELLAYPDGSMGITRNAASIGTWEQTEQEDCVRTFMDMGTAREPIGTLVLLQPRRNTTIPAPPSYPLFSFPPTNN